MEYADMKYTSTLLKQVGKFFYFPLPTLSTNKQAKVVGMDAFLYNFLERLFCHSENF